MLYVNVSICRQFRELRPRFCTLFLLAEMSRIFGKRATIAYLHVLSLSSQSKRVITVYEFPLVLHASVHPRHSRYSSGAACRGKVLTHTWKGKGDLASLTLRKQMVLFMSETFPLAMWKITIVPSARIFWESENTEMGCRHCASIVLPECINFAEPC